MHGRSSDSVKNGVILRKTYDVKNIIIETLDSRFSWNVCTEILSDIKTPIEVMRILKNVSDHCYMLESMEDREKWRSMPMVSS